jgi:anti-sigma regulatory factor (Ser/Thr protein kinase)/anti-anti-sigma regulatory factor
MARGTGEWADAGHRRPLTCDSQGGYPVAVVRLIGTLDDDGVGDLRAAVRDCLPAEPEVVVLDVAGLTAAEDHVAVFSALADQLRTWPGSTLVLADPSPAVAAAVRRRPADVALSPTVDAARGLADPARIRLRFRTTLPASPVAAPVARRLLGRACRLWSVVELLEPAELVATELVANAVRYARRRVVLTVSLRDAHLQISVRDDSTVPPHPHQAAPYDEHGRGLSMVEALCSDWGTATIADGKVVWAKLAAA